jgi:hypothetical protein
MNQQPSLGRMMQAQLGRRQQLRNGQELLQLSMSAEELLLHQTWCHMSRRSATWPPVVLRHTRHRSRSQTEEHPGCWLGLRALL